MPPQMIKLLLQTNISSNDFSQPLGSGDCGSAALSWTRSTLRTQRFNKSHIIVQMRVVFVFFFPLKEKAGGRVVRAESLCERVVYLRAAECVVYLNVNNSALFRSNSIPQGRNCLWVYPPVELQVTRQMCLFISYITPIFIVAGAWLYRLCRCRVFLLEMCTFGGGGK